MSKYPELDKYVSNARLGGKTKDQLRVEMKSAGYSEEDIKEVLGLDSTAKMPTPPHMAESTAQTIKQPQPNNLSQKVNPQSTSLNNKKNKVFKIISIIIVISIIVGGAFYAWKTNLFASVPYSQDNLFAGIASKMSDMETFSYSFNGSLIGEPRDSDAMPFVPAEFSMETKEKYYRDYQRMLFVKDFVNLFRYSDDKYPLNLSSLPASISPNDPLTNEVYPYERTENGENFRITIVFETRNSIEIIENKILSNNSIVDGQKVILDEDAYYMIIPAKPPENFYESLNSSLDFIPPQIVANVEASFRSDFAGEKPSFEIDLSADGDMGDISYKADANVIQKDEKLYVKVNNFPSIFMMFMPFPKAEWVLLDENYWSSFIGVDAEHIEDEEYKNDVVKLYKEVILLADENNLLKIINNPVKEKMEEGVAYKYELEINKDAISPFIEDLINELQTGDYPDISELSSELVVLQEYANTEEFDMVLDYYNKNTKNNLWVDSKGYIVKFETSHRLVPTSERLSDRQFTLTLGISLNEINEEIQIVAPENYTTLEEVQESIFGGSQSRASSLGSDASTKANLNNIRAQAELVYDVNNGYGTKAFPLGSCEIVSGTLFADENVFKMIEAATFDEPSKGVCYSGYKNGSANVNSFAVSVPLTTDSDYSYCVDSTGQAGEILGVLTGTECR